MQSDEGIASIIYSRKAATRSSCYQSSCKNLPNTPATINQQLINWAQSAAWQT